ncbi:trifunctional transcriptional activator/DNA repair protein Ada/methylated-DNA--[protein]-cysteine S-methyltransferase [uncultured Vagococcus sp.]|uniref:bifunctional transcriptional activator/DNA repair enzyme AdaA n=1 Tax=uncultured Vagococcus sp. TaxID=189676 RepID=UPI0028D5EF1A|nr:trifunctional transcriptional activator/DNA repair protein Ada/methylated-DNA--[protein]-cysteine S-methyltransferase [uncultured Vagococcus sp.]
MIKEQRVIDKYYQMLIEKNSHYEGTFYVGVKTTGVFCRPTCPAKKPKKENCQFFETAQEATLSGFRPCKRCQPLNTPSTLSPAVKKLIEAIEENPQRKWTDRDFDQLSISANTARRQFKTHFGMTFIEYSRARRLGLAFNHIRNGKTIIETQLASGFDSGNGFRDAFSSFMGVVPKDNAAIKVLTIAWIETVLGPMTAIADDQGLYLLEFVDRRGLEKEIDTLRKKLGVALVPGTNPAIKRITWELGLYFKGELKEFETPVVTTFGTTYQQRVWAELCRIPMGQTISYKELAFRMGDPNASRAVARANGGNQLSLLIPCHRVINSDGQLGGYGGGLKRKEWLLKMEKRVKE